MSFDSYRPFISGIVGAIIASAASFALEHWHMNIPKELQEHLNFAITGIVFVIITKFASKYFNPGDSASTHLITVQRSIVADEKAKEKQTGEQKANVQKMQEEEKTSN